MPVASFTIRISAPGIERPDGSSTRPLIVPLGDCPIAALVRTRINKRSGRGKRLTRAATGSHGFIQIHPVYGCPVVFVSIFFWNVISNGRWSVFRTLRDDWDRCARKRTEE